MNTLADRMKAALAHREAIAERGEQINQASLARACGVKQPSVNAWFSGETKSLRGESLLKAANYLRVSSSWLASGAGQMSAGVQQKTGPDSSNAQPETIRPYPSGNRIPVVGTAQLGDNGHFVELEYPVGHGDGWIDIASRDPNAYAVRCRGDSMKPRIQAGEFVVVEPNQEPVPGDEVLVKARDGRVMVKRYLYRRDGRVHMLSVNEAHGPVAIEDADIEAMHYVAAIVKALRWSAG